MMIHSPKWPERIRDPMPADSGEWPRVRKVRRLPRADGISRRRILLAVIAGAAAWWLPFALFTAVKPKGEFLLLAAVASAIMPLHVGVASAWVAGRLAEDHARFMSTLAALFLATASYGLFVPLVAGGAHVLVCLCYGAFIGVGGTLAGIGGGLLGACIGKGLLTRTARGDAP